MFSLCSPFSLLNTALLLASVSPVVYGLLDEGLSDEQIANVRQQLVNWASARYLHLLFFLLLFFFFPPFFVLFTPLASPPSLRRRTEGMNWVISGPIMECQGLRLAWARFHPESFPSAKGERIKYRC